MLLEAKDLNVYYGAIHALQGVSFSVDEGEIVSLIGANGAGKSTTLKTVSGLLRPRVGDVLLRGESLKTMPAQDIVRRGVIHVPEGRKIFAPLTVQENLERLRARIVTRRDPRAGRPQDLRAAHRPGEPGDGRVHAQGQG